ncbi:hypothetical protein K435DRAFT_858467 [Dendrothele bispora CBS 962.96]|uniref:Uncharacterized protein n=1 Tax=Dendrothele bispora (strain CBS 962.96) TaxID=1314807 RepID=A0A4S8M304_DENBC|nr:hypothetical protein K435DRAFT_858467 [Dendrothele bispora CBS 962.96]
MERSTPSAPRIPPVYLPTPEPTRFRLQQLEPRRNDLLSDELRRAQGLRSFETLPTLQGPTNVPESVYDEARVHEMLTERSNDPRSPQSHRTPIPGTNRLSPPGPQIELPTEPQEPNPDLHPSRNSSPFSSGSSIRITGPLGLGDRVDIPGQFLTVPERPPNPEPRSYQSQYESVMGSALNQTGPAMTTASTHPRSYPTPRDALMDVGGQCLRFGRSLGIQ